MNNKDPFRHRIFLYLCKIVMIICGFALSITYFIQHEKILAVCWVLIAIFKTLETAIYLADDFDDLNEDR